MPLVTTNPATGEQIATYDEMSADEIGAIVDRAHAAWLDWKQTSFDHRAMLVRKLAGLLREDKERLAALMSQEMGKPIAQARAEVEKCAIGCDHYAEHAERDLAPEIKETDASKSYVAYRPLGVVLAIMPWNYPFWQVLRFAAPALMAGNAAVLKHAANVTGCALAVEELIQRAGFPDGLFRTLRVKSSNVDPIIAHPHIAAITLTGSTAAGQAVAATAGAHVKRTVLELGGSDPYLILEDADIDKAVAACAQGRLQNTGQSCIAAKRFVVVEPVREVFQQKLIEAFKGYQLGDPMQDDSDLGPMARTDLRDGLHEQVKQSVERGAEVLLGGQIPESPGAFYPPTILANVVPGMPAYDEEMFGPVAAIIAAKDEEDAIRIGNDTIYGLGGAVFTEDIARGEKIAAERIEAGSCFVNAFVKSDPRIPFGGIKASGYGRELSEHGIREFVNIKTVYIA
jgi:succinate-semialdehyde dehydrogenase/glutarate-semialdehyde dehydrogenase